MRDLLIAGIVMLAALAALRRPWIGIMAWTWISLMNPHRYAYGFSYDAPLAMVIAIATLAGMAFNPRQRESPFKGGAVTLLMLFMVWVSVSWMFGFDPSGDYPAWSKVMKIDVMILVSLALLHSKKHIVALIWVCALSLALLGAKGGLFTIATGGGYRVWGPSGSFIADNNQFALALVMTIPLLRFLQLQLTNIAARHGMTMMMILVAAAALGSQSRGALLAITAMGFFMWWRGRNRFLGGLVIAAVALSLVSFMPDQWSDRMSTIQNYEEDGSAMGRVSAWWVAWGIAKNHVFGAGFNAAVPELFALYSPISSNVVVAHSIYFQVLGHHGFIGLGLYLALWFASWRVAAQIRSESRGLPQAQWCHDLASMGQVSLLGFAVGGAFLNLAYFDLPYNVMTALVLTRTWVRSRGWEREPVHQPGWFARLGMTLQVPVR